jgi:ADYC domain
MKKHLLISACLLFSSTTFAAAPQNQQPQPRAQAQAQTRPSPCWGHAPQRDLWPNGTPLWGTSRKVAKDETSTMLASVSLDSIQRGGKALKGVRLQDGRLVAPPQAPEGLDGAMLQGADSDGKPVEVALCDAEPSAHDSSVLAYRIELWDAAKATWINPCIATAKVSSPRAFAVQGVWDASGGHQEQAGRFTLACENGAIAKCINWGYKPWAQKDGQPLQDLHQACTRMARADYCGNGRSHTNEETTIDVYDGLGIQSRTTETSAAWVPEQASFEAEWMPEGASCLARTRDGQAAKTVQEECPGRFEVSTKDLGQGDRCTLSRKEVRAGNVLLRNRSYGKSQPTTFP